MASSKYSKFRKDEFNQYDQLAKELVKLHYKKHGITLTPNPDMYMADLIDPRGKYVEVEIRSSSALKWTTIEFPRADIGLATRKLKYTQQGMDVIFIVINETLEFFAWTHGSNMKPEYLRENSNRRVEKGEKFYFIPKELWTFDRLKVTPDELNAIKASMTKEKFHLADVQSFGPTNPMIKDVPFVPEVKLIPKETPGYQTNQVFPNDLKDPNIDFF